MEALTILVVVFLVGVLVGMMIMGWMNA